MNKWTPGPWKRGKDEPFVYTLNTAGTNRFYLHVQSGWITTGTRNRADDKLQDEELRDAEIARCLRVIADVSDSDAYTRLIDLADEIEHQVRVNVERRAQREADIENRRFGVPV